MKLDSHFDIGDKAWIYWDEPVEVTIGQIQMTHTKPKRGPAKLEERYMTYEYGIGSGSFFIFGKSIYRTEAECIEGNKEAIAEKAKRDAEQREQEREWLLQDIAKAQAKLAQLSD